jgi:hypothetical protein
MRVGKGLGKDPMVVVLPETRLQLSVRLLQQSRQLSFNISRYGGNFMVLICCAVLDNA